VIDWGTVFVVGVFGAGLFGSAFLADLLTWTLRTLRGRPDGTTKTKGLPAPAAARKKRPLSTQQAPPLITDRPIVRLRLVRRSPPA
jgi:hypothetical protein